MAAWDCWFVKYYQHSVVNIWWLSSLTPPPPVFLSSAVINPFPDTVHLIVLT